ncbi:unnamed protein product [Cuscuta campestris]|uniref:Uncharacterized protein n=1 Tax=Cuscuta campestris TaxID=132261 RepID=A0A484M2Q6_9ASTE|nr:unnamed protein product [Cuscuta campestris]
MQTIEEGRRRRGDDKGRRGEEAKTMENGVTREGDGGGGFIVETLEYPLPIVNPARHILLFCKLERATEETGAALFFFPGPAIAAATASRNRHSVNRRLATWRQLLFKPAANFLSSSGVTGDPSGNQYRRRPPWSETQQRKSDSSFVPRRQAGVAATLEDSSGQRTKYRAEQNEGEQNRSKEKRNRQ